MRKHVVRIPFYATLLILMLLLLLPTTSEEARNDPSLGNPGGQAPLANRNLPIIESHLYAFQQHMVVLEEFDGRGGAIEPLGDTLLLVTTKGRIALIHADGEVVYLQEKVPMNQAAIKPGTFIYFRVADIVLHKQSSDTFTLFVSHHYHAGDCVEFRISSTSLHLDSETAMTFSPWQTIFIADPCLTFPNLNPNVSRESGGRLLMDGAEHLLVVIGAHRQETILTDEPDVHLGKLVRIQVTTGTAEILASGLRNPQGFARDADGTLWETEHGPQGGDELNILRPNLNYGWPYVTHGIQYGNEIWPYNKVQGRHDGFEKPVFSWVPAIAPSNLIISDSQLFPLWKNDLLIASLRTESLFRVRLHEKHVMYVEPIHIGTRIRDITQMPDGRIALLSDAAEIRFLKRFPGYCIENHIYTDSYDDCIDVPKILDEAGEPVIRSNYDVYIDNYSNETRLIYFHSSCSLTDIEHRFFLHIIPIHLHDLPEDRKQHGFDNLNFSFNDTFIFNEPFSDDSFTFVHNDMCIAVRYLPQYDIKQIQTGQFTSETGPIWEGEVTFGQTNAASMSEKDDTSLRQDDNLQSERSGPELFAAQCASCHNLSEQHSIGPHLAAVIGRRSGRVPGYNASAALTSLDIVWTRENLAEFILNPSQFAPGTSMSTVGIPPAEAQSIADFLASTK